MAGRRQLSEGERLVVYVGVVVGAIYLYHRYHGNGKKGG